MVAPVSSVPCQGRQPPEVTGFQRCLVPYKRVTGFRTEGAAVHDKEKCCLADLSIPGAVVESACPVKAIVDSGSGILTISKSVAAKLRPLFPTFSSWER